MNNYYTLYHLLEEFRDQLTQSILNHIYSYRKGQLSILISNNSNLFRLQLIKNRTTITAYFDRSVSVPNKNRIDLFDSIYGNRIMAVSQLNNERVWIWDLESEKQLLFRFFGAKLNLLLLDGEKVISSFKKNESYQGLKLKELLPVRSVDTIINTELKSAKEYLLAKKPNLPRTHLDRIIELHSLDSKTTGELDQFSEKFESSLISAPSPRRLKDDTISLVGVSFLNEPIDKDYSSVNDMIKDNVFNTVFQSRFVKDKETLQNQLSLKCNKAKKQIIANPNEDELLDKAEEYEKYGHLLMSYPQQNESGLTELYVQDYFTESQIRIHLKEDLTINQNARKYYKKASGTRESIDYHINRKKILSKQLRELSQLLDKLDKIESANELALFENEYSNMLDFLHEKLEVQPFNIRQLGKYEIWVGKNARSNDKLIAMAHKDDVWLHARNVSGSHVVIRMNKQIADPPANIVEKAAAIAAWNSKARGSGLAPVQVTRKKYVRKKKGMPPGAVIVEKENVVMVIPSNG